MRNLSRVGFCMALLLSASVQAEERLVAKVNNAGITAQELESEVDKLIPQATYHGRVSEERRDEFREQALETLITSELQYQDARARGMKPDRKQVKALMQQVRERFRSKSEYRDALERAGITEEGLRKRIEKDVVVGSVIDRIVTTPAQVSDGELREYYDGNAEKFLQPESVRVRIISSKDEAKAKASLAQVKAGEDFGLVASRSSEDDYRIRGGDLGYVHRGRILPELEAAAFTLPAGAVSGIIRAEGLWFIVKVEDRKPAQRMSFEESKDRLRKDLEARRSEELRKRWMDGLRAKASIERLWKPAEGGGQ